MSRVSATHDEEASAKAAATEANTGAPTMYPPYLLLSKVFICFRFKCLVKV